MRASRRACVSCSVRRLPSPFIFFTWLSLNPPTPSHFRIRQPDRAYSCKVSHAHRRPPRVLGPPLIDAVTRSFASRPPLRRIAHESFSSLLPASVDAISPPYTALDSVRLCRIFGRALVPESTRLVLLTHPFFLSTFSLPLPLLPFHP
jgi:hypothetical protein